MSAAMLARLTQILLIGALLSGCTDLPTTTVSKCFPADGDCDGFIGENARVEADPQLGSKVYTQACVTCHGLDGKGRGNTDRGNFADPGWQLKWSDSELSGIVTAGRGMKMPGFRFSMVELKSVVAHIRAFDPKRGKTDAVIKPKEGQGPVMQDGPY